MYYRVILEGFETDDRRHKTRETWKHGRLFQ